MKHEHFMTGKKAKSKNISWCAEEEALLFKAFCSHSSSQGNLEKCQWEEAAGGILCFQKKPR